MWSTKPSTSTVTSQSKIYFTPSISSTWSFLLRTLTVSRTDRLSTIEASFASMVHHHQEAEHQGCWRTTWCQVKTKKRKWLPGCLITAMICFMLRSFETRFYLRLQPRFHQTKEKGLKHHQSKLYTQPFSIWLLLQLPRICICNLCSRERDGTSKPTKTKIAGLKPSLTLTAC
jgi:hypothetical protein